MSHIISYVKRQKNKTFEKMPFNEVDALVLSQFIYLKLDDLIPCYADQNPSVSLKEIVERMDPEKVFIDERYAKDNKALFKAVMDSRRFNGMKMNYYSSIVSVLAETQFAAMTVFLENGPTVVVFRGTDETLVGWKEDFNMCLKEPVTGQRLSAMYLKQVSDVFDGNFIVAGHSKGGNFAVYSSMNVEDEVQSRIERVYSFDGPGFRPEILESIDFNKIKDRICKFLPHSSIIGLALQSKEDYTVIESSSIGLFQHNPYNWQIEKDHFKRVRDMDRSAQFVNETVNEWLFGLDDDKLHAFAEIWYQVVTDANVGTLLEFSKEPGKSILSLIDAIKETDDETKEMAKELAKSLIEVAKDNIRYYAKNPLKIREEKEEN